MKLSLSLEGVDQFADMLKELGEEVGSRALRDGAMRGGAVVAAEAQMLAPVGATHKLSSSIHAEEVTTNSRYGDAIATGVGFVGVVVGPDWKAWYGHFTEGGTSPHELKAGGFHPGIPGQRFMQRALDENADEVLRLIGEEIRKSVDAARAQ